MFYLVYQTTNNINGRTYIGVHQTSDIDDGYLGSGTAIKRAIKKYGRENFSREILHSCESQQEMFDIEAQLVDQDYVSDATTYNLVEGGQADNVRHLNENLDEFRPPHKRIEWARNGRKVANAKGAHSKGSARHQALLQDPQYKARWLAKIKEGQGARGPDSNGWLGKKHTDEQRNKISAAKKGRCGGIANSQYGTMWITNSGSNKKISRTDLDQWTKQGWIPGRSVSTKRTK